MTPLDPRRIVAMGGGGFGLPPGDPALDLYVLEQAAAEHPRICLLPTAGGDPDEQIRRFYRRYRDEPCEPTHVSLFRLGTQPVDLAELLLAQDVIYVGGGSLVNLLAIWRAHRLDRILRSAWERGIVLCGISAGAMCWFASGVTTSHGPPALAPGLGFLPHSCSVHYHGEPDRRPVFRRAVEGGDAPPGYGIDDGAGILFAGTQLAEAVASRETACAYRVEPGSGERAIETRRLPDPEPRRATPLSIAEFRELKHSRR